MKRTLLVHIDGRADAVGQIRYDCEGRRQRAAFAYEPSWLTEPQRFAIDPAQLQLVSRFQFQAPGGSVFQDAIADTEPDGWAKRVILREHARRLAGAKTKGRVAREELADLDFLLSVDDESRIGALRFCEEGGPFLGQAEDGQSRAPTGLSTPPQLFPAGQVITGPLPVPYSQIRQKPSAANGTRPLSLHPSSSPKRERRACGAATRTIHTTATGRFLASRPRPFLASAEG